MLRKTRRLKLSQGYYAIIDASDYDNIGQYKWHWHKGYAARNIKREDGKWTPILLHRYLLGLTDPNIIIDHINKNGLDNRRINLRITDKSGNGCNRGPQKNNTLGYKGVQKFTKYFRRKPYMARLEYKGIKYNGPYRETIQEAAYDYNLLAIKYHGEYANINRIID